MRRFKSICGTHRQPGARAGASAKRGNTMLKKKTHKAASKRCKVTATGKVLSSRAGKRHLAAAKSRKRKRNLRGTAVLAPAEQKRIKSMLAS